MSVIRFAAVALALLSTANLSAQRGLVLFEHVNVIAMDGNAANPVALDRDVLVGSLILGMGAGGSIKLAEPTRIDGRGKFLRHTQRGRALGHP